MSRSSSPALGRFAHGGDDADVGTAAADVSAHALANLIVTQRNRPQRSHVAGRRACRARAGLVDERHGGADLSRRAIATLEAVVLEEGLLHRMQALAPRESLDRDDAI